MAGKTNNTKKQITSQNNINRNIISKLTKRLFKTGLIGITFGTLITTSVLPAFAAPRVKADTNVQQQIDVSTSAADLGGKVELDCGTIITLKHSESCSVGGSYLSSDNPKETIPLEKKPLLERVDDDKLILLEVPL